MNDAITPLQAVEVIGFALAMGAFIFALQRWQRRQSEKGNLLGYDKDLGTSTLYGISRDAKEIQSGQRKFNPTPLAFILPAIFALIGGILGFIPPLTPKGLAFGSFFCVIGLLLVAASIRSHMGLGAIQNKFVIYLFISVFFVAVGALILLYVIPEALNGYGVNGLAFVFVFMVLGSFYAYWRDQKRRNVLITPVE